MGVAVSSRNAAEGMPIDTLIWVVFFIGLIVCGTLAANDRVPLAWVVVRALALVGFRLTQPVAQYGVEGTTGAHQPPPSN
jgi:hypothetical protein